MQERLARRQVEEEVRQLRSRIAHLTRDEAELRDTEEAYHLLVDRSLQGLLIIQDQRIVFANQAAADITGHGMDELLTATLEQAITFIHPEDQATIRQRHEDRLKGLPAPSRYAVRAIHKDGSLCWLELQAGVIEYRGRPAVQIALTDITAHQQTALALEESESKLKSIFRATSVGIGLLCHRVLREVNDRFCEMIGYRREELLGQNARMLYPTQEDYDYVGREKYGQIRERGAGAVKTRWQRKDGAVIDVLVGSIPVDPMDLSKGVTFTVLDITEQKRADDALRENKAKLETILDSSPCAIVVSNLEGRVVDANAASLTMFGVPSKKEGIGRSLFEFVSPRQWDRARDYMASALRDGLVRDIEYKLLTNDGSEFIGDVSSNVIRDAAGHPCGFVTVMSDITERKRSESLTRILHDLAVNLGAVGDLQEGLRLCLQAAFEASELDCGGIYLRDETSGAMDLSCHTGLSKSFVRRVSHYEADTANVQLTLTGEPIYTNYARLSIPPNEVESQEGLQAVAIVPLVYRKQVIGCLNVASHSMAEVPQHSRITLETIAGQISGTITRLKAEEALSESKQRMDLALQGADLGTWDWNVQTGHVTFNERWAQMLGYTLDEIRPHVSVWERLIHPDDLAPVTEILNTHLQGQTDSYAAEHRLKHKSGDWIWVLDKGRVIDRDANGKPLRACGTHLDITERKQAEEALRVSEERFRTLFEAAPDAIYLTDLEGHLVDANKTAERLAGVSKNQALGRSLLELGLLSEQQAPRAAAHLKANARGEATGPEEFTLRRPDGVCVTMETRTFPITIDNRTLVLGIARDITERKHAEKQAREHHEQLLHISRLRTLGEMASGFAHELNQPLSAILSYASALRRSAEQETRNQELIKRNLDQVIAQTKRAGEIVKRVRAFVQQRPALLRPTDTNDIIREALAFLHFDVLHKEVQVVLDLGAGLPRVQADAIQLEQALLNLVRNAIEAMETTEPPERRLTIRTTAQNADTVKVTVSDTGMGLSPEIRDRLFNPFVTTKPNGLGVGLSITRTIIELHRGQLWVEPGDGRGCTFVFTLPAAQENSTTSG